MRRTLTYMIFLFAMMTVVAQSPVRPRVAGLETNEVYMELLQQEDSLQRVEDSLSSSIAALRARFREESQRRTENSELLRELENNIFDVRNRIGVISVRIGAIEQEFILLNLDSQSSDRTSSSRTLQTAGNETSANLIHNPFFAENLSADDYRLLREAQSSEKQVADQFEIYRSSYSVVSSLAVKYESAISQQQADSIYELYKAAEKDASIIADKIAAQWGEVFDNKIYSYNYLLDRMRRRDLISEFERKGRETRESVTQRSSAAMNDVDAGYAPQKILLLDYERTLADLLGYRHSLDSLNEVVLRFNPAVYDFPAVNLKERFFLDYAAIEVHNPAKYSAKTPIPQLKVHERGIIYRILLGSYTKQQPVSLFKGVYPIGYLRENNRFHYFAGGFETHEGASAAVGQLRVLGFKEPKVAVWDFGDYRLLESTPAKQGSVLYNVEITVGEGGLDEQARETIRERAQGIDVIRSGPDLFIVGPFNSAADAEILADAMRQLQAISVSVTTKEL